MISLFRIMLAPMLLCLLGCGAIAKMERANSTADIAATADGKSECGWQCLEWGEARLVDTRGVKKCSRECKNFLNVCKK